MYSNPVYQRNLAPSTTQNYTALPRQKVVSNQSYSTSSQTPFKSSSQQSYKPQTAWQPTSTSVGKSYSQAISPSKPSYGVSSSSVYRSPAQQKSENDIWSQQTKLSRETPQMTKNENATATWKSLPKEGEPWYLNSAAQKRAGFQREYGSGQRDFAARQREFDNGEVQGRRVYQRNMGSIGGSADKWVKPDSYETIKKKLSNSERENDVLKRRVKRLREFVPRSVKLESELAELKRKLEVEPLKVRNELESKHEEVTEKLKSELEEVRNELEAELEDMEIKHEIELEKIAESHKKELESKEEKYEIDIKEVKGKFQTEIAKLKKHNAELEMQLEQAAQYIDSSKLAQITKRVQLELKETKNAMCAEKFVNAKLKSKLRGLEVRSRSLQAERNKLDVLLKQLQKELRESKLVKRCDCEEKQMVPKAKMSAKVTELMLAKANLQNMIKNIRVELDHTAKDMKQKDIKIAELKATQRAVGNKHKAKFRGLMVQLSAGELEIKRLNDVVAKLKEKQNLISWQTNNAQGSKGNLDLDEKSSKNNQNSAANSPREGKSNKQKMSARVRGLEVQLTAANREKGHLREQIDELQAKLESKQQSFEQALSPEIERWKSKLKAANAEKAKLWNLVQSLRNKVKQSTEQLSIAEQNAERLKKEAKTSRAEFSSKAKSQLRGLEAQLRASKLEQGRLSTRVNELEDEVTKLKSLTPKEHEELTQAKARLNATTEAKRSVESMLQDKREECERLENKIIAQAKTIAEIKEKAKADSKEAALEVKSRLQGMEAKMESHFAVEEELRTQIEEFESKIKKLDLTILDMKTGKEKLQEELSKSTEETKKLEEEKKSLEDKRGALESHLLRNITQTMSLETKLKDAETKGQDMEEKLTEATSWVKYLEKELEKEKKRKLEYFKRAMDKEQPQYLNRKKLPTSYKQNDRNCQTPTGFNSFEKRRGQPHHVSQNHKNYGQIIQDSRHTANNEFASGEVPSHVAFSSASTKDKDVQARATTFTVNRNVSPFNQRTFEKARTANSNLPGISMRRPNKSEYTVNYV